MNVSNILTREWPGEWKYFLSKLPVFVIARLPKRLFVRGQAGRQRYNAFGIVGQQNRAEQGGPPEPPMTRAF